jgi:hypothetical protein
MMRPEEAELELLRDLKAWNLQAAREFEGCLNRAKDWRAIARREGHDDGDAFSNVLEGGNCGGSLKASFIGKPDLFLRARACIDYYRHH